MTVLAATAWPSNAELIEDCARLGYLRETDYVLDPTYGRGIWWKKWCPTRLVIHDLKLDGVDFRYLPEADGTFDVVAFDPPYVSVGGRKTTTIPEFYDRYAMDKTAKSPAELQAENNEGLAEIMRVLRRKGFVIAKCQDYISSGKFFAGTYETQHHALSLGFKVIDRLEHIGRPRRQPPGRRQVHARRNLSTLFVFQKP